MADAEISDQLIERLCERAHDPSRRSDSSSLSASTVPLGSLLGQLSPGNAQLQGLLGQLGGLLGGVSVMAGGAAEQPRTAEPLAAPAAADQLAAAEQATGRTFPAALKQLYCGIADGGFGPGDGLFPLDRVVREYREMTTEPAGPQNQLWPANLLPLVDGEPGYDCLDLDSGEVIRWDPEEIDSYSDAAWKRSFKPVAASLADWLEDWLGRPSAGDRLAAQQERWRSEGRSMAAEGMVNFYAKKTPEERAAMGLPEVGWEEELLRRNGLL
jgi:hypothetical protein